MWKTTKAIAYARSKIEAFLEEDINSRICPGKKDFVTKNKLTKQIEKYPGIKISYAFFCRSCPFWIRILKVADRETCKCVIHANFELIAHSLYTNEVLSSKNTAKIIKDICCNIKREECILRTCDTCKHLSIITKEFDSDAPVTYYQWLNKKETYFDKKNNINKVVNKITKEPLKTTNAELLTIFEQKLNAFMAHEFRISHQHEAISNLKKNLSDQEILIHCDFSENYNLKYNEEAQSFHFGGARQQVTLHTVVVYSKVDGKLSSECFCTLSECLKHNASAIWAHLIPVLRTTVGNANTVHFLSDSPSTQYRNKFMFAFLVCHLPKYFPHIKNITWNYHEAGHGKGAPDGVGGTCKRTADRIVAQGNDIGTFDSLVDVLRKNCPGIRFLTVSEQDVENIDKQIRLRVKSFLGTLKVHQVKVDVCNSKIWFRSLSCFNCDQFCCHYNIGTLDFNDQEESSAEDSSVEEDILTKRYLAPKKVKFEDVYNSDHENDAGTSRPTPIVKTGTYVLVELSETSKKQLLS